MPRRLIAVFAAFLVTAFSLLLLVFVGYGESSRVYPRLVVERVAALAEVIRSPLNNFADTGLPLSQFTGFDRRAAQVKLIEPAIKQIVFTKSDAAVILGNPGYQRPPRADAETETQLADRIVAHYPDRYVLSLPVEDKFGPVGDLILEIDRQQSQLPVETTFAPLLFGVAGAVAFVVFVGIIFLRSDDTVFARRIEIAFALVFFALLTVMSILMVNLLAGGIKGKTEGLSQSLAYRLSAATEIGVHPRALGGVEAAFKNYQTSNPEIRHIYLLDRGRVSMSTDARMVGVILPDLPNMYVAATPLAVGKTADNNLALQVVVTVPSAILLDRVWRAAKNFVVLFIACGLVALTLIGAGRWMGVRRSQLAANPVGRLGLVKPAYFMGVFIDALVVSFLPLFAKESAVAAGFDASWASLPFTLYFIALTATLLPTGWFAARYGVKPLFLIGTLLAGGGLLLLAILPGFYALILGRVLSGAGQGILMIATQTYSLLVTPPEQRTQAAAVQVFGFNGGLLAGSAIGGLLAAFAPVEAVFLIGAGLGVSVLLYIWACLPGASGDTGSDSGDMLAAVKASFADPEFLKTCFLVGAVSKFVLAGVIMFAMPLVLTLRGYPREDVGQMLMLYAIATLLSVPAAAKYVDRKGSSRRILATGGILSGCGVLLLVLIEPEILRAFAGTWLGLTDLQMGRYISDANMTLAAMLSVVMLGIAQGMLAAPAITHIAGSPVAERHGRAGVVATYRLAERSGHITGPVVVSKILGAAAGSVSVLAVVGLGSIAGALLFAVTARRRKAA